MVLLEELHLKTSLPSCVGVLRCLVLNYVHFDLKDTAAVCSLSLNHPSVSSVGGLLKDCVASLLFTPTNSFFLVSERSALTSSDGRKDENMSVLQSRSH